MPARRTFFGPGSKTPTRNKYYKLKEATSKYSAEEVPQGVQEDFSRDHVDPVLRPGAHLRQGGSHNWERGKREDKIKKNYQNNKRGPCPHFRPSPRSSASWLLRPSPVPVLAISMLSRLDSSAGSSVLSLRPAREMNPGRRAVSEARPL